jgi:hypothetical protein
MDEVPNVNNEEEAGVDIDNPQDGEIDPEEGQMNNNPLLPQGVGNVTHMKDLYSYNEQEINDLLRPDEGEDYSDVANNQLDYNLLNDEEDLLS